MQKLMLATLLPALFLLVSAFSASALETGTVAPDFTLPTLENKEVSLSDYRGQIIILKLATTWCPTCKQQVQEVAEISDFLQENNVAVVEVFLQDSDSMIRDHLAGIDYPMPHAALKGNNKVAQAYNVYVIPRVLVIDRDFKIRRDGSLISAYDLKRLIREIAGKQ